MSFLPDTYDKPPQTGGNYMKLQDGDNRIRAMSPAILGHVFWSTDKAGNRKPVRRRMDDEIDKDELGTDQHGQREKVKHFWAFVVWNYAEQALQILEITQRTIQDAIFDLDRSCEWGDAREYDLVIKKSGKSLDTSYAVTPCKPTPTPEVAVAEHEEKRPNLEALFSGGDPFDGSGEPAKTTTRTAAAETKDDDTDYVAIARRGCIEYFKNECGPDANKRMAEEAATMFPGKKSADYTEADWHALEGALVPF